MVKQIPKMDIPDSKSIVVAMRLTPKEYKVLKKYAKDSRSNISNAARFCMRYTLDSLFMHGYGRRKGSGKHLYDQL